MPRAVLKEEQRNFYRQYAGELSIEQLDQYFYFSEIDLEQINEARTDSNKLGFALQLGTVRFLGGFFESVKNIPSTVVHYVASQLKVNPDIVNDYTSATTIKNHKQKIQSTFNYRKLTGETRKEMLAWFFERAMVTSERESVLIDQFLHLLLTEHILLPRITSFERLVASTLDQAKEEIYMRLVAAVPKEKIKQLEDLLVLVTANKFSSSITKMDHLKQSLTEGKRELERGFQRLKQLNAFQSETWDLSGIPHTRLKKMAEYTAVSTSQSVQRFTGNQKIAHLVALVAIYRVKALDELLQALIVYYSEKFTHAKNKELSERKQSLKKYDSATLSLTEAFSEMKEIVKNEALTDQQVRERLSELLIAESLEEHLDFIEQTAKSIYEPIAVKELIDKYPIFTCFLTDMIELLPLQFAQTKQGNQLKSLWNLLCNRHPKKFTFEDYSAGKQFVPKKWQHFIENNPNECNRALRIVIIELLVPSLKNHNAYISYSRTFKDPMTELISDDTWKSRREALLKQLHLPEDPKKAIQNFSSELHLSYGYSLQEWSQNTMTRIEKDHLVVSTIRKKRETKEFKRFLKRVKELMPAIDLADLLMEINQRLDLTQYFYHISQNETRMTDLDISMMAVLLAEATNIGIGSVSKKNVASLKQGRLSYVRLNYERLETLIAANNCIVTSYNQLDMAAYWGDGTVASADGIRYVTPRKSIYSKANNKYYGKGHKGITYYNFVSDHYIGFQGMVIPGTERDSLYILEGLLEQSSELSIQQISTDTAGYSALVFGLFGLLGYQFSPRIADSGNSKIWRINKHADYKELNPFSKNTIRVDLIEKHWADILKVIGSLKEGLVSATELIRALRRENHSTSLGQALEEVGKIFKTKHLLRYYCDEDYARAILNQLNKGESRHNLCRKIYFGKNGKLYQAYYEGMEDQLSALGLVTNAVIYWNALYLEKVLTQITAEGIPYTNQDIESLSPLLFEHINFVGQYSFQYDKDLENGKLRALNRADS